MQIALLEEKIETMELDQVQEKDVSDESNMVSRLMAITELDDALMQELVKKIIVFPDGSISIVWNFRDTIEASDKTLIGCYS